MNKFLIIAVLAIAVCATAEATVQTAYKQFTKILTSVTAASTGDPYVFPQAISLRTHQAALESGSTAAVVAVQGSNDNVVWETLGTITLSSGTPIDGFVTQAPWIFERGKVISITGGAVTLTVGD